MMKALRNILICAFLLTALPAMAADRWIRLTTAHFEMYTTADEKKAREAILHFERVRDFFMLTSAAKMQTEFPTRIIAFNDPQMFHLYATNPSVEAYYVPGPLRDTISMEDPSPESYHITIHEYVHLVVRHSGLHIPLWLNEGWAEVFSTLKPVRDGVAVGDLIPAYMDVLAHGQWFGLDELAAINTRSPEYNESNRTGMLYAESWALAHMLYLSPDYKDKFGKFIGALNRGGGMDEALQTAFGRTGQQVFLDLQTYFARKRLYGTVFLTPFDKSDEAPVVTTVAGYDSRLMLADLWAASGHLADATRAYRQLQEEDSKRPDAFAGAGYLAIETKDKDGAREQFGKAFALGSDDAQLCVQLAALDREAKQPVATIMGDLERAVKLRPDFTEALFELGIIKVALRDFDGALELLNRVTAVSPERTAIFNSALAYSNLQKGNIDAARSHAALLRKAVTTPAEITAADRLLKLIDARSNGPAAVLPGEKLVKAEGMAVGLRCAAPGSGQLSALGVSTGGKQILFDLPEAAAVEITRQSAGPGELKCGALQPFHVVIEYAEARVAGQQSAGIIRRMEF